MLFRYPFVAMGSGCEILVESDSAERVKPLVQSAVAQVARLEAKYSLYRDDSLLARINRDGHGCGVEIDEETLSLLRFADGLHGASEGAFDPTVGSLQGLWDFRAMSLPDPAAVAARLPAVGWPQVEWRGGTVRLPHPATRLDFGGWVKEYAVDAAVATLSAHGVRRGLVNLGGDLRLVGEAPQERPFRVGIAHPRRHHDLCGGLRVTAGAVVTSGDYQRYFLRDGRRYHHILDPRTGFPAELAYTGVTTHGATALEALRAGKLMLLGTRRPLPEAPPFLACDADGEPVAWQESPHCRVRTYSRMPQRRAG
jgi:thiamine biosynthesis lipoprotein